MIDFGRLSIIDVMDALVLFDGILEADDKDDAPEFHLLLFIPAVLEI